MTEDIRGIKTIIGVFDLGTLLFFLLSGILIILSGCLIFMMAKKRLAALSAGKESFLPAEKPFNEIAEEALSRMDPVSYFEKGKTKEFYFAITEIVRVFLAKNYLVETLDKTSFEIIEEIERAERDFEKIKMLDSYFQRCDLVKFAKYRPTLAALREAKDFSLRIVRECFRKPPHPYGRGILPSEIRGHSGCGGKNALR